MAERRSAGAITIVVSSSENTFVGKRIIASVRSENEIVLQLDDRSCLRFASKQGRVELLIESGDYADLS